MKNCATALCAGVVALSSFSLAAEAALGAADAEAICEAVRRPTMRFVWIKSAEQQGQLMQHRTRDLLMRQRTRERDHAATGQ